MAPLLMGAIETALEARPAMGTRPADKQDRARDRRDPSPMTRLHYGALLGAVLVGLLVRAPGVFWGANFPGGWRGHHIDEQTHLRHVELLVDPSRPPKWTPQNYPKGLAAHVAAPVKVMRRVFGYFRDGTSDIAQLVFGRVVSVLYGTASIVIVFLLARRLFRDGRVALLSAWIFALGGLHVSQSHFFVADVPSLFWFLVGTYLLLREWDTPPAPYSTALLWAAFAFGVAFGLKLVVAGLPTLALMVLMRRPRVMRAVHAAIFFGAGFFAVTIGAYPIGEVLETLSGKNIVDGYEYNHLAHIPLYLIELPSLVSFPVVLLALVGAYGLGRRMLTRDDSRRLLPVILVVLLPQLVYGFLVIWKLDHFPRHLLPFVPWIIVLAAWANVQLIDMMRRRGFHPALAVAPLLLYLVAFVYDGERVFWHDPRNETANWIRQHVPPETPISWRTRLDGYPRFGYPRERGPLVAIEMHYANLYLSGMGFRDSYPRDYRQIFDGQSQARVDALQALFKGTTEYREVARFDEGYFMPEYRLADRLIGNRARNYVAEVVIFMNGTDVS